MPIAGRLMHSVINVLHQQRLQQQQAATSTSQITQCPRFGARIKETGILHPPKFDPEMERSENNIRSYNLNLILDIRYRQVVACYPFPVARYPLVSQNTSSRAC